MHRSCLPEFVNEIVVFVSLLEIKLKISEILLNTVKLDSDVFFLSFKFAKSVFLLDKLQINTLMLVFKGFLKRFLNSCEQWLFEIQ